MVEKADVGRRPRFIISVGPEFDEVERMLKARQDGKNPGPDEAEDSDKDKPTKPRRPFTRTNAIAGERAIPDPSRRRGLHPQQ